MVIMHIKLKRIKIFQKFCLILLIAMIGSVIAPIVYYILIKNINIKLMLLFT